LSGGPTDKLFRKTRSGNYHVVAVDYGSHPFRREVLLRKHDGKVIGGRGQGQVIDDSAIAKDRHVHADQGTSGNRSLEHVGDARPAGLVDPANGIGNVPFRQRDAGRLEAIDELLAGLVGQNNIGAGILFQNGPRLAVKGGEIARRERGRGGERFQGRLNAGQFPVDHKRERSSRVQHMALYGRPPVFVVVGNEQADGQPYRQHTSNN